VASDAGVIGTHPFLALRWLYRAQRKGEQRVGGLQQFAADLGGAALYCAHDELGYHQSFEAVARAVVSGLRLQGPPAREPYYREVFVMSLNGIRVGVASIALTRDEDGDTQMMNRSALVAQRAPGELMTQDTLDVQWVRPDGSVINASQVKAADGKLTEDLALKAVEGGGWRAEGKLGGKAVSFDLPEAPDSYIAQTLARRKLLAQADPVGGIAEGRVWNSLDLTRLLPSRATVLAPAGDGAYAVREEVGSIVMDAVLDRSTGTLRSAKMPLGPLTMTIERVLQQGAF
jgi:hypothetical protein